MSSGITLSAASRQNLLSLQGTADLLSTTQNRLSTGKKVNSALDNPVNFFTSQSLDSRSSTLSTLLDGISNGIQVIQAANQGITSLQKLTSQLTSLSQQALASSSAFTSKATSVSNATGTATNANILGGTYTNNTVTGTVVNNALGTPAPITGATLLGGTGATDRATLVAGDTLTLGNGATITVRASGAQGNDVNVGDTVDTLLGKIDSLQGGTGSSVSTTSPNAGKITLNTGTTSDLTLGGSIAAKLGLSNGTTARATTGGLSGTFNVTVGSGATAQSTSVTLGSGGISTLSALNTSLSSIGAQALVDSNGKLNITTTNENGTKALAITGASGFGTPSTAVIGGDGLTARNSLVSQYNSLLTQIDQQAKDASYNGVNLLNGDNLKVVFNEKNSSFLNIQGTSITSAGLGLNTIATTDFQDSNSINNVLTNVSSAVSQLKSQASAYGSNLSVVQNRQDFTKNLVNILDTGSANLTNADMNEEAANSQALSTRNSLGISALSLANQAQQGILQLLR